MSRLVLLLFLILAGLTGWFYFFKYNHNVPVTQQIVKALPALNNTPQIPILIKPTPIPIDVPVTKTLPTDYWVSQSFNNCGPASLSMDLYFYGIKVSQQELGQALRPYQVVNGDNDDKSVTLDEMAKKGEEYGFVSFHRPNGNINMIKQFISIGIPVIAETLSHTYDDIGHYRVVKGFDENRKVLIQDDSLQGKNLSYTYDEFNSLWEPYNYEYLVLIPKDKVVVAEQILGEDKDLKTSWTKAAENAKAKLKTSPNDTYAGFNLSIALYNIGDYTGSVKAFEQVESKLTFRTLWYQIEPIEAYYQLGNFARVFEITDRILTTGNRAFSELYIIRGNIYLKQGKKDLAKQEFEKAVLYNKNLKEAIDALKSVQ